MDNDKCSQETKSNKNKQANSSKQSESDAADQTKIATKGKTAKKPKAKGDKRAKVNKRARTKEEKAKERKRKKKKRNDDRPIEEKESYKWIKGMENAHKLFADKSAGAKPRLIHVMDREGDVHEVFEKLEELEGDSAIIRCSQNRAVDDQAKLAHAAVRGCKVLGTVELTVSASKEHCAHEATLEVRATTVTLKPSQKKHAKRRKVTLNLVEAWEPNPPEGSKAICWRLWTLEPVGTFEESLAVVKGYSHRWRIEEYHLALKSGSNAEKLELSTADRLMRAIVLYAPVAMRVVTLRDLGRRAPDSPCTIMFTDREWRVLQSKMSRKKSAASDKPPTIRQVMLWIGKLGGHQGRKSDGLPGIRTLWRGCEKLTLLVMGHQLKIEPAPAARAKRSSAASQPGNLEGCLCW